MHTYRIYRYSPTHGEQRTTVNAHSIEDILRRELQGRSQHRASTTRRWQHSPHEADRDNLHIQFDGRGLSGIAIERADIDPAGAEHRNNVAVARRWVAEGRTLADLQAYGGYRDVIPADLEEEDWLLSLERRGLVRARPARGYMWSPRTHVHWHATDAGRAAYEEDEPCQSS